MGVRRVSGRYDLLAASRHPRLDVDYDSQRHRFREEYLRPKGYAITVDAFPGMRLVVNRSDQQVDSDDDRSQVKDIYRLEVPPKTTGFEFVLEGQMTRPRPVGPPGAKVKQVGSRPLASTQGVFSPDKANNAWNWSFTVPGPGTYTVTTSLLPWRSHARVHTINLSDTLIVSIGDSAAAGQGNPDRPGAPAGFEPDLKWWEVLVTPVGLYKLTAEALDWSWNKLKRIATTITAAAEAKIEMDPKPVWLEPAANRSLLGGHSLAAAALERRSEGRLVTYLPFGRSGSTIAAGLIGPRSGGDAWANHLGQIDELATTVGRRRIDALLIYIGINEVGVTGTLTDLLTADVKALEPGRGGVITTGGSKLEVDALGAIASLSERFDSLESEIRRQLNVDRVYLTEYPTALFDNDRGTASGACGIFAAPLGLANIDQADAMLIKKLVTALNTRLQEEAARHGWVYITDIARAFSGHGYCASKPFFRSAEESLAIQGDTQGSVHPNQDGARAIASAVTSSVRRHTFRETELVARS